MPMDIWTGSEHTLYRQSILSERDGGLRRQAEDARGAYLRFA